MAVTVVSATALSADLLSVLAALERHHILRPHELPSLGDLKPPAASAAMFEGIHSGHVGIRFIELTPLGKTALEWAR